jgi:hypothetical protein
VCFAPLQVTCQVGRRVAHAIWMPDRANRCEMRAFLVLQDVGPSGRPTTSRTVGHVDMGQAEALAGALDRLLAILGEYEVRPTEGG